MASKAWHSRSNNGSASRVDGTNGKSNHNAILLALPRKECDSVLRKLEWVDLPTHTVLHETGQPIKFGYFINDGLASILSVMSDGKSVEVELTGKEGFVGEGLLVGFKSSPTRIIMQVGGNGFRTRAQDVPNTLRKCAALEKALQRYSQELTMQARQVAACNRVHEVEARLARWLLMSQDRLRAELVKEEDGGEKTANCDPATFSSIARLEGTAVIEPETFAVPPLVSVTPDVLKGSAIV